MKEKEVEMNLKFSKHIYRIMKQSKIYKDEKMFINMEEKNKYR
jgi:hypothetical protein